mmetsp:Transcript_13928/g.26774  ORF Transcript_13928/g.26774 Transcript_13928/m.26774 type:complete len:223 (+) Transcript_13928:396-1064(+)
MASLVMLRSTPSVASRAFCCTIMLLSGSVRILYRSSFVRPVSSTLMGKRPCSSASMSLGFTLWNEPLATKSMWLVLTWPNLVFTRDPSTIGSRSCWTPSLEASVPVLASLGVTILSISSMKMIPSSSAIFTASFVRSCVVRSLSISRSSSSGRAFPIFIVFLSVGFFSFPVIVLSIFNIMSLKLLFSSAGETFVLKRFAKMGSLWLIGTSMVTSLSSISPSL